MGLSIHYSGRIKSMDLIPALVEEVQDVCTSFNWKYHLFDDEDFTGICFSPTECEPVFLTFHNSTELANPISWQYQLPLSPISTKTQFAGIETHIALLKLLKHLKEKYFAVFELDDEGYYWNTWNEEALKKQFDHYNFLLDSVAAALKDFKAVEGESPQSLADRLESFLKERWKDHEDTGKE